MIKAHNSQNKTAAEFNKFYVVLKKACSFRQDLVWVFLKLDASGEGAVDDSCCSVSRVKSVEMVKSNLLDH